jgi:uncharacterized protein YndB with AHSA1/START domain
MTKAKSISMRVTIKARPVEVFRALSNSRSIQGWSGQKGKVEATIGGRFEMFDKWVKGKVLAYQPGKILSYTWSPIDWKKGTEASIVRYTFSASGSSTIVRLRHSGFPSEASRKEHREGWTEHVFDPLKGFFKSR